VADSNKNIPSEDELKKKISDQVDTYLKQSEVSGNTPTEEQFREYGTRLAKNIVKEYKKKLSKEEQDALENTLKSYFDTEMVRKYKKSLKDHPRSVNGQKPLSVNQDAKKAYEQTLKEEKAALINDIQYLLKESERTKNTPSKSQVISWLQERMANDLSGWDNEQGRRYVESYVNAWIEKEYDDRLLKSMEEHPRVEDGSWPWATNNNDGKGTGSGSGTKSGGGGGLKQLSGSKKGYKSKAPFSSNYVKTYQSFSGHDMVCTVEMPLPKGGTYTQVIGEIQTITYSIHQEKTPIRCLGDMNAKGYVFGPRTIAGTLIFTVFDRHWATNMEKQYLENAEINAHMLADEFPPLNITISCANEYGYNAVCSLFGVTLVNEGQVMSINDVYTENTYQFYATDVQYLAPVEVTRGGTNKADNLSNVNTGVPPSPDKPSMQVTPMQLSSETINDGVNPDPPKPKKSESKKYEWKNQQTDDAPTSYQQYANTVPGCGTSSNPSPEAKDKDNEKEPADDKNKESSKEKEEGKEKEEVKDNTEERGNNKDKESGSPQSLPPSQSGSQGTQSGLPYSSGLQQNPQFLSAHMLTDDEYNNELALLNKEYKDALDKLRTEAAQNGSQSYERLMKRRVDLRYAEMKQKLDSLHIQDVGKDSYKVRSYNYYTIDYSEDKTRSEDVKYI